MWHINLYSESYLPLWVYFNGNEPSWVAVKQCALYSVTSTVKISSDVLLIKPGVMQWNAFVMFVVIIIVDANMYV